MKRKYYAVRKPDMKHRGRNLKWIDVVVSKKPDDDYLLEIIAENITEARKIWDMKNRTPETDKLTDDLGLTAGNYYKD